MPNSPDEQSAELGKQQKVKQLVAWYEEVLTKLRDQQTKHPQQSLCAPSERAVRAYIKTLRHPSDDDVVKLREEIIKLEDQIKFWKDLRYVQFSDDEAPDNEAPEDGREEAVEIASV